ncbi:hypothetical protein B296_00039330 [Ensete ventricosum]|uniref:Uncharacterized protein n=1 Tax=Ensete ventricosum TaxID=4639 RepID=A0A426ZU08_ENSVE|nr:hypothetical protein B296_00039330 [Ensete ventricosum]
MIELESARIDRAEVGTDWPRVEADMDLSGQSLLELVRTKRLLELVRFESLLGLVVTESPLGLVKTESPLGLVEIESPPELVGTESPLELRGSEQDEREVRYSPRAEEAQSGAPTEKRSHKERLTMVETRLDVLEASLEELYQGQQRLLGVESLQEEAESRIDRVESLVD